jgi:exonuclease III
MAASAHSLRPLNILADNVNGLGEAAKRKAFFAWLQDQRVDVALLSETHTKTEQQAQQWVREGAGKGRPWEGLAFFGHKPLAAGEQAAAGVAVLLSASIVAEGTTPCVDYRDTDGRVIRVAWTSPWQQQFAAIAVYAPAVAADRPAFFTSSYQQALEAGALGASIVAAGDYNCCLDPADVQPTPGTLPSASSRMGGGCTGVAVASRGGPGGCLAVDAPNRA